MTRLEKISAAVRERGWDAVVMTAMDNLCYATGLSGLEGMALVTADGRGFCYTDSRYIEAATAAVAPVGYQVFMPEESYAECAAKLCGELNVRKLGFEDRKMTVAEYRGFEAGLADCLTPAHGFFDELREVKEEEEVERMVKAQRIAEAALEELLPQMRPGAVEQELAADLEYYMRRRGSEGVSFPTILVSGEKSSLPHGHPGSRKLQRGDFVTIDFGATYGGYHSDMTRTFAIGEASEEMKRVYDTVLRAQLAGIEALEVGRTGKEVDAAARRVIADAGYGAYFGHGLGHSLGLMVHENPRAAKTYEGRFRQGNIITMEPGIYLPGRFGVRIEDMLFLSASGKRNLTAFPKELCIL